MGLPLAQQMAPNATPAQQDELAGWLVFHGGDISKLPPNLKALIPAKK